jgi:hypothetical protein
LTPNESKLLLWVLEHGSDDLRSYLPQLEGMRAAGSCDCGCTSIYLEPLDSAPLGINCGERIVGEFLGVTVSGDSIGLILFQDCGRLSELEIYPYAHFESKSPEANFPKIEGLEPN